MAVSAHLALSPEPDLLRRQFEQLTADAQALAAPLTDDQFNWTPSPDVWSVAECLEHLNVSARVYLPALDEAIAEGIRKGLHSQGPYQYNWVGRLYVASMEPPPRFSLKAPAPLVPAPRRDRKHVMAAFKAYHVQYVDRLRQADGLDLARAQVRSPIASWIRLPLGSAFHLMAAHGRRHLHQATNLTARPDFPR